jgi:ABC-type sugar transport system ATPase subunit
MLNKAIGGRLEAGEAVATIRPEDVRMSRTARDGWLEFRVYSVLPTGAETIVTVRDEGLDLAIKLSGFVDIEMNDSIWVDFDADNMNYYDPQTEKLMVLG